ncbi:uncharacterized protein [Macrobrachium rosenbergii]|uniref:uncharacterized protein n=1 Tax=Macrobrachium rosenbergii TaxID=79674 RepID=UPI0034D6EA83
MKSLLPTAALILITLVSLSKGDRKCYNCTGDCVNDDLCDGSCMTITHELGDEPEVRGCVNDTKPDGCVSKVMDGQNYKVCYCNTHRCNSSNFLSVSALLLLLVLVLCFPK